MIAETEALVGAALEKAPTGISGGNVFAFPGVREWFSFTAEPAFANSVSLLVGFVAGAPHATHLGLLRPMTPAGDVHGHFHAAAFPYRPVRRGRVALDELVRPLFDNENVLGLLHLVNDWRDASGAGQSRFLRGACWCAPIEE